MKRIVTALLAAAWLLPTAASADRPPAKGRLLVATEQVQGIVFSQTVILLLHYDATGAMGIVLNRPTDIAPGEVVDDGDAFSDYDGTLYWGGPVQMNSLRALMRTDTPPPLAEAVIDAVHLVPIDDELEKTRANPADLRLFIGYAGWSAGQLDRELARGSWHVLPASDDIVFTDDPHALWQRLVPPAVERIIVARQQRRSPTVTGVP